MRNLRVPFECTLQACAPERCIHYEEAAARFTADVGQREACAASLTDGTPRGVRGLIIAPVLALRREVDRTREVRGAL